MMNLQEFAALVGAYGSDPVRWPLDRRTQGQALLEVSTEARSICADAATLDALLSKIDEPQVSSELTEAVLAIPHTTIQTRALFVGRWLASDSVVGGSKIGWHILAPQLTGLAAAALIGFLIGASDLIATATLAPQQTVYDLSDVIFDDISEEVSL